MDMSWPGFTMIVIALAGAGVGWFYRVLVQRYCRHPDALPPPGEGAFSLSRLPFLPPILIPLLCLAVYGRQLSRGESGNLTLAGEILLLGVGWFAAGVDWETFLIPDPLSLGGTLLALVFPLLLPGWPLPWRDAGVGFASVLVLAGGLNLVGCLVLRRSLARARAKGFDITTPMGWGDVKLFAFYGGFLGWQGGVATLFGACLTAALAGSALRLMTGKAGEGGGSLRERWEKGEAVFPLGPFIVFAGTLVWWIQPS
ncbi:MAG: A24 family peptidase [Planctomycetota bacterium]|jgi:prepilin signal peptidase PulO-like enzyme (type II secretory pathway)|nr:A24 family peptidase [Planctomycetota bacterium]